MNDNHNTVYNMTGSAPAVISCPRIHVIGDASQAQIGGSHYKDCPIQPAEYATANGFGYCESLALRYITRHRKKNGRQDIEKAIHCLQLLLEMEYPQADRQSHSG